MFSLRLNISKKLDFLTRIFPPHLNRILAIIALTFGILFLIYFDYQQGFTSWQSINAKLSIFVAINVNILLLIIIFYWILRNLIKLIFEGQKHELGVKLKTKLIIAFVLISFPATVSHLFTTIYTTSSLDTWLLDQKRATTKNRRSITRAYYNSVKELMQTQGKIIERALLNDPSLLENEKELNSIITEGNAHGIAIYERDHSLLYFNPLTPNASTYWKPMNALYWDLVNQNPSVFLPEEIIDDYRLIFRSAHNVSIKDRPLVVEVLYINSKPISEALNELQVQQIDTAALAESDELIKSYYIISLFVMVLMITLFATWFAFYLAKGFVHPIEHLAEATHRVAQGELGFQVPIAKGLPLDKDFAQLVNAFNAMSQQLLENREALVKTTEHLQISHRALSEHSRFVELVLENIKTGVVSLDINGNINSLNRSAKNLLQLKTTNFQDAHYEKVLDSESLEIFEEMFQEIKKTKHPSISKELSIVKNDVPLNIAVTLLTLKNNERKPVGMISVYENVTEIQRFQKALAWRDVAKRIAHEIKNPLTPIQLSAQRIRRKYLSEISNPEILDQGTKVIINEVETMKNMVKEFSKFATIPESDLQPNDLNNTITEAVELFNNALSDNVRITTELDENVPYFALDREQMKRVFINLIDNAIAAVENEGEIKITTHFDKELKMVRSDIIDSGSGVPPEILHNLFEPYVTSQQHGTGLGLSIVSQIISDHNGYIRHQNVATGGSCFSIELSIT